MAAASGRPAIVNPLSGERITILETGEAGEAGATGATGEAGAAGDVLVWELLLAPGGRVPSSHSHPRQEERFTVIEGRMRFRVGRRRLVAEPGDTVVVAPGTVHHFANPGPLAARVEVRTAPALGMAELLETAALLAREQHAAGRWLPRLSDTALFMRDFEAEVAAPVAPAVARSAARVLAAVAGRLGPGIRYRRLRGNPETHAAR
jgi:mannose-6-phosphate isomerase-like protein (cupin superfamily)